MTIYLHNCQICNQDKPHRISMIKRNRGVRLQCLNCGKNTLRFYNIQRLRKTSFKEFERGLDKNG